MRAYYKEKPINSNNEKLLKNIYFKNNQKKVKFFFQFFFFFENNTYFRGALFLTADGRRTADADADALTYTEALSLRSRELCCMLLDTLCGLQQVGVPFNELVRFYYTIHILIF